MISPPAAAAPAPLAQPPLNPRRHANPVVQAAQFCTLLFIHPLMTANLDGTRRDSVITGK